MKIILSLLLLFFSIFVIISACAWTSGTLDELVFPEENVSFLLHVKPFLQWNCSYSPCHGATLAGGIGLLEYHNVVAVAGFIDFGNPDGSKFVQILDGRFFHRDFYRGNIKENHIQGIRQWIKEGGINN